MLQTNLSMGMFLLLGMSCLDKKNMVLVSSTHLEGRRDLPPSCARRKNSLVVEIYQVVFSGAGPESLERRFGTCNGVYHCSSGGNGGALLIVVSVFSWVLMLR